METKIEHKWPQWPALKIQEWLKLDLGEEVKYHYRTLGKFKVVFVSTHTLMPADEKRPWPDYPILRMQEFLALSQTTDAVYEDLEYYLGMYVKGSDDVREAAGRAFREINELLAQGE